MVLVQVSGVKEQQQALELFIRILGLIIHFQYNFGCVSFCFNNAFCLDCMAFDLEHIDCCIEDFLVVVVLKRIGLVVHCFVLVDKFVFDVFLVGMVGLHFDGYSLDYNFAFVDRCLVVLERFAPDFDNYSCNFFGLLVYIDFVRIHFVHQFALLAAEFVDCIDCNFDNFVVVVVDKIIAVAVVDMQFAVDNKSSFQLKFCT